MYVLACEHRMVSVCDVHTGLEHFLPMQVRVCACVYILTYGVIEREGASEMTFIVYVLLCTGVRCLIQPDHRYGHASHAA